MRTIAAGKLNSGMVIGHNLVYNGNVVIPKNTVVTFSLVNQIISLFGYKTPVTVYEFPELKQLLFNDSTVATSYIVYLIDSFGNIFNTQMLTGVNLNNLVSTVHRYFFIDRNLLYEAVSLRYNHCYTYEHSLNVALYSLLIGMQLNLESDDLRNLIHGSILHDIGKTKIPNSILDKPSSLTQEEFNEIKKHPLYGYNMIKKDKDISEKAKKIVLQHHEKLDGSGYPQGLTSRQINPLAKIVAVADIFDAVTSARAYHKQRTAHDGVNILLQDASNKKISKDIIDALIKSIIVLPVNTVVTLSNGVKGYVVENCNSIRPVVYGFNNVVYDLRKHKSIKIIGVD